MLDNGAHINVRNQPPTVLWFILTIAGKIGRARYDRESGPVCESLGEVAFGLLDLNLTMDKIQSYRTFPPGQAEENP